MATGSEIVEETRRHLLSGQQERLNRLNGAIIAGAVTLVTEFDIDGSIGAIVPGHTIAINDEEMHVFSVDTATDTATVQRGMNGSTDAGHALGDLIYVQPKFSNFRIIEAVKNELRSLSAPQNGLFQIKTVDLTFNASQSGYDLTGVTAGDVLDIYEVRYQRPGPEDRWPRIRLYELARNMATTEFASGLALILHESAFPGNTIRVRYKAPFDTSISSSTADVAATSGLPASAIDILSLGAAIRLTSPRDIKRSFTESQGEPRRAEEVQVGSGVTGLRGLFSLRAQRIQEEAGKLQSQYPTL